MKIIILRKMRYQDTFIYILQFSTAFQYLFAWNGEVYQDWMTLKPSLKRRILFKLGRVDSVYTTQELEAGEEVVLSGALASIDKLIADGKATRQGKKAKVTEIDKIKAKVLKQTGKKCQWQATETNEGFYYQCLTHGQIVKMKDGERPVHEVLTPEN